eukprot:8387265-Pyramimonas_sp.AAC.1
MGAWFGKLGAAAEGRRAAQPPKAWRLQADVPEEFTRGLKAFPRVDKLKKDNVAVPSPTDLLQYLPKVEPLALGA